MKCLSRPTFDRLYPLFIAKVDDYLLQYDCIFRYLQHSSVNMQRLIVSSFSIQKLLEANSTIRSERPYVDVCTNVYTTLTSALGNRIVSTSYLPEHYPSWDPHAKDHPQLEPTAVTVGLVVNEENVNRLFDHGPAAEDESAAASFRQFWGEKAELRRFKDGRILESLVWTSHRAGNVLEQIIQYVIMRHCGREAAASIDFLGGNLDAILLRKEGVSNPSHVFDLAWNQYSQLEKRIRDLEGLPLTIRQVSPSSPALRRTSRFSPNVDGIPQPIDITVQFEASTRWPGDLVAVQRMKAALCLKLGTLLEQIGPYRTRVSLENDHHPWLNQVALDISMEGKTTFRLRIHHEHDIVLLEDKLKSQSEWARESIASALASYKRMFLFQPVHTQVVQGLCTRYPLLSSSIRLLKQWLVSHLLAPFFCDELVELITIRAFTYAHPYSNPGSLRTAFLRILLTIAKWDWQTEPLVVELNGELDAQEHRRMQMHFEGWRSIDPAMNRMVMFVSSNLDPEGTIWTDKVPKVVAARLVALAQAACSVVKRQGLESKIESLFIPSLAEYDFTLIMNPKYLRKQSSYTSAGRETGLGSDASDSNLIDCFLVELQSLHSETIIFFHGGGDSDFIGGLWNPHSATRPWKPSLTHSTAPVLPDSGERGSEGEVTINKMGILNDILRLGGDLVQEVKVKKSS